MLLKVQNVLQEKATASKTPKQHNHSFNQTSVELKFRRIHK